MHEERRKKLAVFDADDLDGVGEGGEGAVVVQVELAAEGEEAQAVMVRLRD